MINQSTKIDDVTLFCQNCGLSFETNSIHVLNVREHPQYKHALFEGLLNAPRCPKCNVKHFINQPFLYVDPDHDFSVQYYPPDSLDDEDFFRQLLDEEGKAEKLRQHVVFNMNEVLRYVRFRDILQLGFDS